MAEVGAATQPMGAAESIFDRKFVTTAVLIGVAYAAIIGAIAALMSEAAAGVTGAALTGVATALFKQFETLRFKQVAEQTTRTVALPRIEQHTYHW